MTKGLPHLLKRYNLTLQCPNHLSKARFFASAALRLRMTGYDLGYFKFWNIINRLPWSISGAVIANDRQKRATAPHAGR
jgi:hypothetical protein